MDIVTIDRLQFAFTVMFHYLFPITTMGLAPFIAFYAIKAARGDAEAAIGCRILDQDLRDQFCDRRRNRHSTGVSVRNELGSIFCCQRRGDRPAACDGGRVRLLPGVGFSRRPALWKG